MVKEIAGLALPVGHPSEQGQIWRVFVKRCPLPPVLYSIVPRVPQSPSSVLMTDLDSLVYPLIIPAAPVTPMNGYDTLSYQFDDLVVVYNVDYSGQDGEAIE